VEKEMSIDAMKQALEALENVRSYDKQDLYRLDEDITALRTAIAEAEKQEPVAWVCYGVGEKHDLDYQQEDVDALPIGTMLYAAAQREWVGLTEEDWKQIWDGFHSLDTENDFQDYMAGKYGAGHYTDAGMYWQFQQQMIKQMVNAKLKEKNT
jgi:hypothetical protein